MCLGARGGPMGGELLVVLRVNRVTVRHPLLLLLLLLQVNQSMWITAAGDSRLPPPLHKRDFDMMKECIDVRGGEPSLPLLRPAHPPSPPSTARPRRGGGSGEEARGRLPRARQRVCGAGQGGAGEEAVRQAVDTPLPPHTA